MEGAAIKGQIVPNYDKISPPLVPTQALIARAAICGCDEIQL